MNNMLNGAITSTISSLGIKIRHPYEQYVAWGEKHQLYLHEGSKFATPSEQYVDWGNSIKYISMRDQQLPPLWTIFLWGNNTNFIFMMVMMMTTMNVQVYDYESLMVMMVMMMMINVHDYEYHDVGVNDDDDVDDDDDEWYAFRHSTFGELQQFATVPRFRRGATSGLHRNCLNHMSPVSRRQVSHTLRCSYVRTCAVQAWLMRRVWESWKGKRKRERETQRTDTIVNLTLWNMIGLLHRRQHNSIQQFCIILLANPQVAAEFSANRVFDDVWFTALSTISKIIWLYLSL